ncbi:MAG: hypothetical protein KKC77_19620 [Proteobacteria bacterium]|nr:hypothetical protein [Pseudomonadota bacterium]
MEEQQNQNIINQKEKYEHFITIDENTKLTLSISKEINLSEFYGWLQQINILLKTFTKQEMKYGSFREVTNNSINNNNPINNNNTTNNQKDSKVSKGGYMLSNIPLEKKKEIGDAFLQIREGKSDLSTAQLKEKYNYFGNLHYDYAKRYFPERYKKVVLPTNIKQGIPAEIKLQIVKEYLAGKKLHYLQQKFNFRTNSGLYVWIKEYKSGKYAHLEAQQQNIKSNQEENQNATEHTKQNTN